MDKEKIKNKIIYFLALASMCTALVLVMYNFFYRTVQVDIMKDIRLIYNGESGSATVTAINASDDINQRVQEFLDSVEYEINPNTNLSNGDTIHVVATYDDQIAQQYHYQAINIEADFIVEGLNNRFESIEDISQEYLDEIDTQSLQYIEEHAEEIYELDMSGEVSSTQYESSTILFSAFLKSNSTQSDRVVSVCQIDYTVNGELRQIYYLVCIPDINDGNEVQTQNIYGEKAYLSQEERDNQSFKEYVQRIFGEQYTIEEFAVTEEETLQEEQSE